MKGGLTIMKKINEFLKDIIENKKISVNNNVFNKYYQVELKPVYVEKNGRSSDNK